MYSFQPVYKAGTKNDEATTIDDENWIALTATAGPDVDSYTEACPKNSTSNHYTDCDAPFYTASPSPPATGVFLNANNNDDSSIIQYAGYMIFSSPPKGYSCTTCGAVYDWNASKLKGTWEPLIEDPSDHSCGVTELLGINGSKFVVGFYETKQAGTCVSRPFEEYLYPYPNGSPVFVNLSVPGSTSAIATGINNFGDVVGTMTPSSGSGTEAWYYNDFNYDTFYINSNSNNTAALGINDDDGIVGSYTASSTTHGFLACGGPPSCNITTPNPQFTDIDEPNSDNFTVVNSLNTHWAITGQFEDNAGNFKGFVGDCEVVSGLFCPGNSSASPRRLPRGARPPSGPRP